MIVDRRRSVGLPARCAGYVPCWLQSRTGFDKSAILQTVNGIRLVAAGGGIREIRAPGYILDRTRFDKTLAIHALEAGADLANALVLKREGNRVVARRNSQEADFEGEVILGADGPTSIVGRSIGQVNRWMYATVQYEVGLKTAGAWVEYHWPLRGDGGYAWFVPCGRTARVGVGVYRSQARFLRQTLERFMHRFEADGRIYTGGVLGCTGGLMPANGPLFPIQADGVLLAGDAGGLSDAFGGGIAAAVISGEIAGEIVGEALSGARRQELQAYDSEIRRRIPSGGGQGRFGCYEQLAEHLERVVTWRG